MIISALKSNNSGDQRSPIHKDTVKNLLDLGIEICFEESIGKGININDKTFEELGLKKYKREDCLKNSDLIITNQALDISELALMKKDSTVLGMVNPFSNKDFIIECSKKSVNLVSMEFIPRITRAQKMDVLSSQANLAGYVAVIEAAKHLSTALPMMMTAAGTLKPAKVFVIGVGVAGLQAIATAKRLGARVEAFDTRDVVEEQVKSLGARFVKIDIGETEETSQGYAKELSPEQIDLQRAGMKKVCSNSDVIITTAQVFGRKAPIIITSEMIEDMNPGSVIVDMAVGTGGNVEGSKPNENIDLNGITIVGNTNLPGEVAVHASQVYSANIFNLIDEFWDQKNSILEITVNDEILSGCLVTHKGEFVNSIVKERYG